MIYSSGVFIYSWKVKRPVMFLQSFKLVHSLSDFTLFSQVNWFFFSTDLGDTGVPPVLPDPACEGTHIKKEEAVEEEEKQEEKGEKTIKVELVVKEEEGEMMISKQDEEAILPSLPFGK